MRLPYNRTPGFTGLPLTGRRRLKLDEDQVHRRVADVFRGMGQRLAIEHFAGFQLTFRGLAIRGVVAVLTAGQNINHIGRMRVDLLFGAGRKFRFENAHPIVLELNLYRLGIDDRRILRRDGGGPDDEGKRRDNCRNNESHGYEKGFLARQLQAVIDNIPALQRWESLNVAENSPAL